MLQICIVDDSRPIRERLVALVLALPGIRNVTEAASVEQAEALFREGLPDVVILDIRLPDGSGITLLEELMRQERPPKVIVFTDFAYPQYRARCLELGAHRFLEKSTEFQQIPGIIAQILEGAGSHCTTEASLR